MKKIFTFFFFFWAVLVHAQYNYHWAVEQKFVIRSSINQINYLNQLISSLKRDNNWSNLDAFWVMAVEAQGQAVFNLISPGSNTLTEVNAPNWVAKQGYSSNGTTSYLNTNFNPNTQGVNYTLNNASIHIYSRSNIAQNSYDIGSFDGTHRAHVVIRYVGDLMYGSINTAGITTKSVTDSRGLFSTQRTASTTSTFYRNGASIGTVNDVSTQINSLNGFICCRNSSGSPITFSTRQYSMAAYGSGSINNSLLNASFEKYMDAIGTGVE